MDDHVPAATDVPRLRIHDGESEADRHRRVDGVAALAHDLDPCLTRERCVARDHSMCAESGELPCLEWPQLAKDWRPPVAAITRLTDLDDSAWRADIGSRAGRRRLRASAGKHTGGDTGDQIESSTLDHVKTRIAYRV